MRYTESMIGLSLAVWGFSAICGFEVDLMSLLHPLLNRWTFVLTTYIALFGGLLMIVSGMRAWSWGRRYGCMMGVVALSSLSIILTLYLHRITPGCFIFMGMAAGLSRTSLGFSDAP